MALSVNYTECRGTECHHFQSCRKVRNVKSIVLSFLLLAGATLAPAAENTSLAGQWKLHSSIAGYESDFECTFTQNNQDFAGTCKSTQATVTVNGKLEDNKVTFQYKTTYEGQELTVAHSGTLESPDKIAGTVDVQPMGVSGDFTASRAK